MGELKAIGRPRRPIDHEKAAELARLGLSITQIAAVLGVPRKTLSDHSRDFEELHDAFETGRALAAVRIGQKLWEQVEAGNIIGLIYASKALLGWRDAGPPPETAPDAPSVIVHLPGNSRDFLPESAESG